MQLPDKPKVASLQDYMPLPNDDEQYSYHYIENHQVIKLRETDSTVTIGIVDMSAVTTLESLQNFHKKEVEPVLIDKNELAGYMARLMSGSSGAAASMTGAGDEQIFLDKLANDAPIIMLVNSILIDAIRKKASDIHLESQIEDVRVRFRVDGVLQTWGNIDSKQFPAVSSRIKIMAGLNIMERRKPQDGRSSVTLSGETIDLRVSVVPLTDNGESIVLRMFTKRGNRPGLDDLGFEANIVSSIRKTCKTPHGLFLVTGPTGSGKTTTLNAILQEISTNEKKTISIEDPVEYRIDGVDQIQTNEQIGLTFESILRRVLRQDPDIIMVGEIRDAQTAELAVRAALTGHFVLSSLHTNDAPSAVARLENMGVEPYLLAAVLRGVMAQRLVRGLCRECREPIPASPLLLAQAKRIGLTPANDWKSQGCARCNGRGFTGRFAIAELFESDMDLEAFLLQRPGTAALQQYLVSHQAFQPMMMAGIKAVIEGKTTWTEIESAVGG